jgi:hypothetical protein
VGKREGRGDKREKKEKEIGESRKSVQRVKERERAGFLPTYGARN